MSKTAILILDYNRPKEAKILLDSIHKHCKFDKKVYYLDNCSDTPYAEEFRKQGLIDVLIRPDSNLGCGFGTMRLFELCKEEYAFYIQVDHVMVQDLTQTHIEQFKAELDNPKVGHIDVAGNQGHGKYSERAQFINVDFYNSIPKEGGGPGPFSHLLWTEESMQNYYKDNNIQFKTTPLIFADLGKWSKRINPDGSKFRQRTDTKQLYIVKGPVKEKYHYPFDLTDEEWETILKGEWVNGTIPEKQKAHSFKVPFWDEIDLD